MDLRSAAALLLLSLLGSCAGQGILPEGPVDAVLGKNVTLTTLMKDLQDAITIIWTYSDGSDPVNVATMTTRGLKVNEPYAGRASIDATNGNLFLGSLKSTDSGDYSVNIVSGDATTSTGEIKLRVFVPVSDVTVSSNLRDAIEHNSTVVLTCTAKGSFLKYTWINGTTPIAADGKRLTIEEVEKDDVSSSTLTVTGVLRTDLPNPVYCSAANKLETENSAPFNLTVYYGPEAVTISPPKPPSVIRSGSDFNLTCSSVSSPPADLRWYHGEQMMEAAGPVLTLKVITAHGLGKVAEDYTCRATNQKTKRSVASPAVSFSVMDAVSGVQITGPTGVLIAGNSSANISCQATKGPVATVTWQKDGKPLSAGGRVVFGSNQTSILINGLQAVDNGRYTCRLGNMVNSEEASYMMVVNCERSRGGGGVRPRSRGGQRPREAHMLRPLRPSRQLHLEVQRHQDRGQDGRVHHRERRVQEHGGVHLRGAQRRHRHDGHRQTHAVRQRGRSAGRRPLRRRHRWDRHRRAHRSRPRHRINLLLPTESAGRVPVLEKVLTAEGDACSIVRPSCFPSSICAAGAESG